MGVIVLVCDVISILHMTYRKGILLTFYILTFVCASVYYCPITLNKSEPCYVTNEIWTQVYSWNVLCMLAQLYTPATSTVNWLWRNLTSQLCGVLFLVINTVCIKLHIVRTVNIDTQFNKWNSNDGYTR